MNQELKTSYETALKAVNKVSSNIKDLVENTVNNIDFLPECNIEYSGGYNHDADTNEILINSKLHPKSRKSTFIHEMGHVLHNDNPSILEMWKIEFGWATYFDLEKQGVPETQYFSWDSFEGYKPSILQLDIPLRRKCFLLFNVEKPPGDYAQSHFEEDFAQSFQLFITSPKGFRKSCPKRFEFLQNMIVNDYND